MQQAVHEPVAAPGRARPVAVVAGDHADPVDLVVDRAQRRREQVLVPRHRVDRMDADPIAGHDAPREADDDGTALPHRVEIAGADPEQHRGGSAGRRAPDPQDDGGRHQVPERRTRRRTRDAERRDEHEIRSDHRAQPGRGAREAITRRVSGREIGGEHLPRPAGERGDGEEGNGTGTGRVRGAEEDPEQWRSEAG